MSVNYGGPPADGAPYGENVPPAGRVNFGWIGESWQLFIGQAGVWIVATLALSALPLVLVGIFYAMMWSTMFPGGFPPTTPSPGTIFPAPGTNPMLANPMFAPGNVGKTLTMEVCLGLLSAAYMAFFYGGLFRMAVQQVRGYAPAYKDIFAGGPLFGRMLGAMLLLGLGGYGLELVCFAPGLILAAVHASPGATIAAFVLAAVVIFALALILWGMLLPVFALMADGEGVFSALRRSVGASKGHWASAAGFVFVLGLLIYASELPCLLGLLATIPMLFLISALAYRDLVGMPGILPPLFSQGYGPASSGVWPPPPEARPPAFGQPLDDSPPPPHRYDSEQFAPRRARSPVPGRRRLACYCRADLAPLELAGGDAGHSRRSSVFPVGHGGGRQPGQCPRVRSGAGGCQRAHRGLPGSDGPRVLRTGA